MRKVKSNESEEVVYDENTLDMKPYTWHELGERMIWRYFFYMSVYHLGSLVGLATYAFGIHSVKIKLLTVVWVFVVGIGTFVGVTAGAHRLWSHRAYKANMPLRVLLMICYCIMGMNPLFYWIRDHRVHHKYSETDADPHNAKRGFFFSHIGWLIMKRHPECIRRGREIDMTDILADPVVMFHKKHSVELRLLFCFAIPIAIPVLFWGETLLHAIITQGFIRYVFIMNFVWCVNSVAHLWGSRPYNRLINPAENAIVSVLTVGEGAHNYHHTFPWDYKAAELPYVNFNITTLFIEAFAKLGWAYNLREPSPELVRKVMEQLGVRSDVTRTR